MPPLPPHFPVFGLERNEIHRQYCPDDARRGYQYADKQRLVHHQHDGQGYKPNNDDDAKQQRQQRYLNRCPFKKRLLTHIGSDLVGLREIGL